MSGRRLTIAGLGLAGLGRMFGLGASKSRRGFEATVRHQVKRMRSRYRQIAKRPEIAQILPYFRKNSLMIIQIKKGFHQAKPEKALFSGGGGAENRTPVHTRRSVRLYKLSPRSALGMRRFASQRFHPESVQSFPWPYRLRAKRHSPQLIPCPDRGKPGFGSQVRLSSHGERRSALSVVLAN